jgi:hypothetical protein
VADDADAGRVDLGLRLQPGERGAGVLVLGLVRGVALVAARAADAAVVVAEHDDAVAREVVGEHEEGLVAHDRLVAVLRARAGEQDDAGGLAAGGRDGEAAGEDDGVDGAGDRGLADGVGERGFGFLRALGAEVGDALAGREAAQLEREALAVLVELALAGGGARFAGDHKDGALGLGRALWGEGELEAVGGQVDVLQREVLDALHGDVEAPAPGARLVGVGLDAGDDLEVGADQGDAADPGLGAGRGDQAVLLGDDDGGRRGLAGRRLRGLGRRAGGEEGEGGESEDGGLAGHGGAHGCSGHIEVLGSDLMHLFMRSSSVVVSRRRGSA